MKIFRSLCSVYSFINIISGPVGIGKSYLLYLLAAEYRLKRNVYRVTYINNCASWRRDRYGYLLKEMIMTFYDDTIDSKSIVDWCKEVHGSDKEEKMMMMMKSLINYTQSRHLQWIFIGDQHNALFNPSVVKDFPYNIVDYLAENRGSNIKVIISASANNEGYPTEMKGWYTYEMSTHHFDQKEFELWCYHHILANGSQIDPTSEEAD